MMLDEISSKESLETGLGELLMRRGKLNKAGLDRALRNKSAGDRLDAVLNRLGLVGEADIADALAELLELRLARTEDYPAAPILEGKLSPKFLRESRVMPLHETADGIVLAMTNPLDSFALEAVRLVLGRPIQPWVAVPAEFDRAYERLYGGGKSSLSEIVDALGEAEEEGGDDDVERLRDLASEAPVIRIVNLLISRAVEARASDIHIEPFESRLRIRYRVDGILQEVESPPSSLRAAIVSRVKIMAKLNIAERRLPQDGRIKIAVRGKEIDLRISTLPTMHGESVVMRILDREGVALDFTSLGFQGSMLDRFRSALERPNGILLVTGPTGSGKTTTLYTSLLHLNSPEKKIVTVEDPIEYQLEGVNQIQVRPQIGLSFANALRSILRQDPDIIMIGEIRDLETAEIATQAALTGHLVLATLHTNTAAGTVTRLLDMGVEDYLLTSTLNGIVAQRLVRRICPRCAESYDALPELAAQFGLQNPAGGKPVKLYRGTGCDYCSQSGYYGRINILEVLPVTDSIRRLILKQPDSNQIQRAAVQEGMRSMYDDGIDKALAGITTLEEILRVTRDQ